MARQPMVLLYVNQEQAGMPNADRTPASWPTSESGGAFSASARQFASIASLVESSIDILLWSFTLKSHSADAGPQFSSTEFSRLPPRAAPSAYAATPLTWTIRPVITSQSPQPAK